MSVPVTPDNLDNCSSTAETWWITRSPEQLVIDHDLTCPARTNSHTKSRGPNEMKDASVIIPFKADVTFSNETQDVLSKSIPLINLNRYRSLQHAVITITQIRKRELRLWCLRTLLMSARLLVTSAVLLGIFCLVLSGVFKNTWYNGRKNGK